MITSGLLASFLGLGDFGVLNTFISYTLLGVVSDLVLWLLGGNAENLIVAILVGIFGHMAKFVVKWMFGLITGAPLGFVALGLLRAVIGYILFGAIGGLLGWLTLKALKTSRILRLPGRKTYKGKPRDFSRGCQNQHRGRREFTQGVFAIALDFLSSRFVGRICTAPRADRFIEHGIALHRVRTTTG